MSTTNGAVIDSSADRWRVPVECDDCDDTDTASLRDPSNAPPRESEAAILEQAYVDGNASLEQAWARIKPAADAMVAAYFKADDEIKSYRLFAHIGDAKEARGDLERVILRHADDGPEDRRDQPKWLHPAFVWSVFIASALYDTVFIGQILSWILDADEGSFVYYASFLPGLGIMVGLLVTGTLLAKAYLRTRERLERRLSRWTIFGRRTRKPDDLPWPMWTPALLFGLFVLGILVIWALIRGSLATLPESQWNIVLDSLHGPSALLLVLLSVAAIALRMLSYNPHAERQKRARASIEAARQAADAYRRRATPRVAEHAKAWTDVQAALAAARSRAERYVEAGRARIMELRAQNTSPGRQPADNLTPMTLGLWASDTEEPTTVDLAGKLRLHFSILQPAEEQAERLRPEFLEQELAEVDAELYGQFEPKERGSAGGDEATDEGPADIGPADGRPSDDGPDGDERESPEGSGRDAP